MSFDQYSVHMSHRVQNKQSHSIMAKDQMQSASTNNCCSQLSLWLFRSCSDPSSHKSGKFHHTKDNLCVIVLWKKEAVTTGFLFSTSFLRLKSTLWACQCIVHNESAPLQVWECFVFFNPSCLLITLPRRAYPGEG